MPVRSAKIRPFKFKPGHEEKIKQILRQTTSDCDYVMEGLHRMSQTSYERGGKLITGETLTAELSTFYSHFSDIYTKEEFLSVCSSYVMQKNPTKKEQEKNPESKNPNYGVAVRDLCAYNSIAMLIWGSEKTTRDSKKEYTEFEKRLHLLFPELTYAPSAHTLSVCNQAFGKFASWVSNQEDRIIKLSEFDVANAKISDVEVKAAVAGLVSMLDAVKDCGAYVTFGQREVSRLLLKLPAISKKFKEHEMVYGIGGVKDFSVMVKKFGYETKVMESVYANRSGWDGSYAMNFKLFAEIDENNNTTLSEHVAFKYKKIKSVNATSFFCDTGKTAEIYCNSHSASYLIKPKDGEDGVYDCRVNYGERTRYDGEVVKNRLEFAFTGNSYFNDMVIEPLNTNEKRVKYGKKPNAKQIPSSGEYGISYNTSANNNGDNPMRVVKTRNELMASFSLGLNSMGRVEMRMSPKSEVEVPYYKALNALFGHGKSESSVDIFPFNYLKETTNKSGIYGKNKFCAEDLPPIIRIVSVDTGLTPAYRMSLITAAVSATAVDSSYRKISNHDMPDIYVKVLDIKDITSAAALAPVDERWFEVMRIIRAGMKLNRLIVEGKKNGAKNLPMVEEESKASEETFKAVLEKLGYSYATLNKHYKGLAFDDSEHTTDSTRKWFKAKTYIPLLMAQKAESILSELYSRSFTEDGIVPYHMNATESLKSIECISMYLSMKKSLTTTGMDESQRQSWDATVGQNFMHSWHTRKRGARRFVQSKIVSDVINAAVYHDAHIVMLENLDYSVSSTDNRAKNRLKNLLGYGELRKKFTDGCINAGKVLSFVDYNYTSQLDSETMTFGHRDSSVDKHHIFVKNADGTIGMKNSDSEASAVIGLRGLHRHSDMVHISCKQTENANQWVPARIGAGQEAMLTSLGFSRAEQSMLVLEKTMVGFGLKKVDVMPNVIPTKKGEYAQHFVREGSTFMKLDEMKEKVASYPEEYSGR